MCMVFVCFGYELVTVLLLLSSLPSPPLPCPPLPWPALPSPPHSHQNMYGAPFLVSAASVLLAMWVAMALKNDRGSKKEDDEEEEESCSTSISCMSKPKLKKKGESEVSLLAISELPQT